MNSSGSAPTGSLSFVSRPRVEYEVGEKREADFWREIACGREETRSIMRAKISFCDL